MYLHMNLSCGKSHYKICEKQKFLHLTHCRLNELPHTIYWKILISILDTSGYEIQIFLEKNNWTICKQWRPWSDATDCRIWSGSTVFVNYPFRGLQTTMLRGTLNWLTVLGFKDTSTLVGPLYGLPEKGRKEIVEMKESDREEKGTGTKVKKQKK